MNNKNWNQTQAIGRLCRSDIRGTVGNGTVCAQVVQQSIVDNGTVRAQVVQQFTVDNGTV